MEKSSKAPLLLVIDEGKSPRRIARIRQQIDDETYITPDKLDQTIDRILRVLEQDPPNDSRQ